MAATTMLAARRRLVELMRGHPDAPPQSVHYCEQPPEEVGPSCIYVAGVRGESVADAALKTGRRRRQEVYAIDVVAKAAVHGGDQESADEVAVALLGVVDETVADYATLDGAALQPAQQIISALVTGWATDEGGDGAGAWRGFLVTVTVTARLL